MATIISVRQQLDEALHAWLVASFSAGSEFVGVTFSKGQQSGEVTMPLVTAFCEEAVELEPGLGVYRVPAAVAVMTTIDEAVPDTAHRLRADVVANWLEYLPDLTNFLNATGLVFVFGFGVVKSKYAVQDRHFVDAFEFDVHCRCG